MKTIHDYTMEIIETVLKAADVESIYKHKVIRKVHALKTYKDFKNRQIMEKRVYKAQRPPAKIVFHKLSPSIQKLFLYACELHEIDIEKFCSNSREVEVVDAQRQVIYFLRREMRYTCTKVAMWFMKDHSTILHSCNKHDDEYDSNKIYKKVYEHFRVKAREIIFEV